MLFLGSVIVLVLLGSSVSSGLNITAKPGEDVTLPCQVTNITKKIVIDWSEAGQQKDEYILFFKDNRLDPTRQHKSFQNRVFLLDRQMKGGNVSMVLNNVTINDTGTYKCRVIMGRTKRDVLQSPPICIINLTVSPPGDEDGVGRVLLGLIMGSVLLVFAAVVPVGLWISKKKKCSNQKSGRSNNQQELELVCLNSDSKTERNTTNSAPAV